VSLSVSSSFPGSVSSVAAPHLSFDGRTIVCAGGWLKTARILDEVWLDEPPLSAPIELIQSVRASSLGADLFTFGQALPNVIPRHAYHLEFDNLAVADTTDYTRWWNALPVDSRRNVTRSQRKGVTVAAVAFTNDLVAQIKNLYDETPVRQGRKFWHYGKSLAQVASENASFGHRSQFLGAFLDGALVGFLKLVVVGSSARIMQALTSDQHHDKHALPALLAAAVEYCAARPLVRLIYGQYVYGAKRDGAVTDFKRRSGFYEMMVPRYYIPFTTRGRIAIAAGLHRGLAGLVPEPLLDVVLQSSADGRRQLLSEPTPIGGGMSASGNGFATMKTAALARSHEASDPFSFPRNFRGTAGK
jgi:hypothetical protein